ncbi:MAG: hypothetical protein ACFFD2_15420 [Promethearchaeota archaeon]
MIETNLEKNIILTLRSDTDTWLLEKDRVSQISCIIKNNTDSEIEISNNLFFYVTEGKNLCWELYKKRENSLERILSKEEIILRPGGEKKLFKAVLYDLFFKRSWYWNWMCRHHPLSSSPLLKGRKERRGYVRQIQFYARVTGIKLEIKEVWTYSNMLKMSILPNAR